MKSILSSADKSKFAHFSTGSNPLKEKQTSADFKTYFWGRGKVGLQLQSAEFCVGYAATLATKT
jgi:hypothetical protein